VKPRVLIRGGCVLTLGGKTANFPQADVLIDAGRIAEVGPGLRARAADVVDASDTIVMPGFVDAHRHAWMSLFRHMDETSAHAVRHAGTSIGSHHGPDDVYAATLLGLLTAVESGITTVVDWCDVAHDGPSTEAALQAHADAGLRTVFIPGGRGDLATSSDRGGQTTIAYGSPDPTADNLDEIATAWSAARDLGLRLHAHVGTSPSRRGVVRALAEGKLLADDVTLVRCASLDDADLDAIASHGAAVALTPSTEMALGLGPPPLQELIDRAIRPGLGVGDERLAPGDLFAQMHAVQSLQHATLFDLKLAGKAGVPNLLSTREVIRYATLDGARAAGLAQLTGSIEPGKQADLVLLRTDRPNISPVNDPIGAVVWGMDPSNVDWVFVSGKPLLRHGVLEADADRARTLAMAARERVVAAGDLFETSARGAP
jgi:cytosine/adenosine deaminase-related metal-dependent hydrolase